MKKLILFTLIAFTSFNLKAQTEHLTGQTKLINPTGRTLLLEKDNGDSWLTFHDPLNSWFSLGIDQSDGGNLKLNYGGSVGENTPFTFTRDGRIGIGTTNPLDNLDISNDAGGIIRLSNPSYSATQGSIAGKINFYKADPSTGGAGVVSFIQSRAYDLGGAYAIDFATGEVGGGNNTISTKMTINYNGKVGIGTSSPQDNLDISNGVGGIIRLSNPTTSATSGSIAGKINFYKADPSTGGAGVVSYIQSRAIDLGGAYALDFATGEIDGNNTIATRMTINHNGNVGIGTTDIPSGYKVAIDGKAIMEEINVQMSENWPDFVFEPTYKLKNLEEVEQYIKTNKHLPDVPSEKEVKENGLSLGQSDAVLLQKIEELTLYLIEQNKKTKEQNEKIKVLKTEIKNLAEQNEAQNEIINELRNRIEKLESKN